MVVVGVPCIVRLCVAVVDATDTNISHGHYLRVWIPLVTERGTWGSVETGRDRGTMSVRMLLLVLVVLQGEFALALAITILILASVGTADLKGTSCFVSILQVETGTDGGLADAVFGEASHQVRWEVVWHLAKVFGSGSGSPVFNVETAAGGRSTPLPHPGIGLRPAPVAVTGVGFRIHTAGAVIRVFG